MPCALRKATNIEDKQFRIIKPSQTTRECSSDVRDQPTFPGSIDNLLYYKRIDEIVISQTPITTLCELYMISLKILGDGDFILQMIN